MQFILRAPAPCTRSFCLPGSQACLWRLRETLAVVSLREPRLTGESLPPPQAVAAHRSVLCTYAVECTPPAHHSLCPATRHLCAPTRRRLRRRCRPANFANDATVRSCVLTVAAVDSTGTLWTGSNWGNGVQIAAPGVNVLSACYAAPFANDQCPDSRRIQQTGTSQAGRWRAGQRKACVPGVWALHLPTRESLVAWGSVALALLAMRACLVCSAGAPGRAAPGSRSGGRSVLALRGTRACCRPVVNAPSHFAVPPTQHRLCQALRWSSKTPSRG